MFEFITKLISQFQGFTDSSKENEYKGLSKKELNDRFFSEIAGPREENIRYNSGFLEKINLMLYAGADVNAINDNGETALMVAVQKALYETVQYLLSKGAKVDITDKQGNSALHFAKSELIIRRLCEYGASPDLVNKNGEAAGAKINALNPKLYEVMQQEIYYLRTRMGLSLAMATDKRLGGNSPIAMLPQHLPQKDIKFYKVKNIAAWAISTLLGTIIGILLCPFMSVYYWSKSEFLKSFATLVISPIKVTKAIKGKLFFIKQYKNCEGEIITKRLESLTDPEGNCVYSLIDKNTGTSLKLVRQKKERIPSSSNPQDFYKIRQFRFDEKDNCDVKRFVEYNHVRITGNLDRKRCCEYRHHTELDDYREDDPERHKLIQKFNRFKQKAGESPWLNPPEVPMM